MPCQRAANRIAPNFAAERYGEHDARHGESGRVENQGESSVQARIDEERRQQQVADQGFEPLADRLEVGDRVA